jgi:hypothetical protein
MRKLDGRFGVVRVNMTLLCAALLASHATSPANAFRASDVRFFFYLFGNWLERDVLYPGETLDLTQVRRLMQRLLRLGFARAVRVRSSKRASSVPAYKLTAKGIAELLDAVIDAVESRSFEEAVLVVTFVAAYRSHLKAMSASRGRSLDPVRLVDRARRRIQRVLHDLGQRMNASNLAGREAAVGRRAGLSETAIAERLEGLGVYQLQHIRSFARFILSFPPGLLEFELGPGFELRSRLLFETFADSARGHLQALDRLEERLASIEPARLD